MSAGPGSPAGSFRRILTTELRLALRRPAVVIVVGVFALIAWLLVSGRMRFGGMESTGVKLAINADYPVAMVLGMFSFVLMHFTATVVGSPVVRDARLGVLPLVGATPVGRRRFLLAKFLGAWLGLLALYGAFTLALCLGQLVPGENAVVLPFRVWPYVRFFALYVGVSTFFVGALAFALGAQSLSMKPAYVFTTVLFVGWWLALSLLGLERWRAIATWEPSGTVWLVETVAKSRGNAWLNENPIRLDAALLGNRAALVLIGLAALGWSALRFGREEFGAAPAGSASPVRRLYAWLRGRPAHTFPDLPVQWGGEPVPKVETAPPGLARAASQLAGAVRCELRLLAAERSLWIMVPIITVLCGVWAYTFAGPFNVPIYPVSSEFAQQMVPDLLLFLAGTTIFYCGEAFHRDAAHGARGLVYATPVPNTVLLLAKWAAVVALSLGIVLLTYATGMLSQIVRWRLLGEPGVYLDVGPYAAIGARVVLPAVVVMSTAALLVNVLARSRYAAYFLLVALGGLYAWRLLKGDRGLEENPFAVSHWSYSDLTGLDPWRERLLLHHAYWGALVLAAFGLMTWLLSRREGGLRGLLRPGHLVRHPIGPVFVAAGLAGAAAAGGRIVARGELLGPEEEVEAARLALEDEHLAAVDAPRLAYERVDLDVRLRPADGELDVRGEVALLNPTPEPVATAWFTIDPTFEVRALALDGAGPRREHGLGLVSFDLDPPLFPGARTHMTLDWTGAVPSGIARDGGPQGSFVHESAVFVSAFGPVLLPQAGASFDLFLTDDQRREELGRDELELLSDKSGQPWIPSLFGIDRPYDLALRVEAPAGLEVVAGGTRTRVEDLGATRRFHFESDGPVRAFPILAGHYAHVNQGPDSVWYHPEHAYNLDTILEALADARRVFERAFGPYPHRELRIVEFPRLASFAQSFPTLMPYSESIGFLTNWREHEAFVDATYFVTAHEVAHQWWGYVLHPGASLGGQVLSESLAEYSAMMLLDETRGERERLVYLSRTEDAYLRARDPDEEAALCDLATEGAYVWYNKGAFVFQMLERRIGREALCGTLRAFADRWRWEADPRPTSHPTVADLLALLEERHPGSGADGFYDLWFRSVAVPDPAVLEARATPRGDGTWDVRVRATNHTEGVVTVGAEAIRGTWDLAADADAWNAGFEASASARVRLVPGEEAVLRVTCDFEPEEVILDRLFECLDFDRTNNRMDVEVVPGVDETGVAVTRASSRPASGPAR